MAKNAYLIVKKLMSEEVLGTVHRGGKAGHSHCLQGKGIGDDTSG